MCDPTATINVDLTKHLFPHGAPGYKIFHLHDENSAQSTEHPPGARPVSHLWARDATPNRTNAASFDAAQQNIKATDTLPPKRRRRVHHVTTPRRLQRNCRNLLRPQRERRRAACSASHHTATYRLTPDQVGLVPAR